MPGADEDVGVPGETTEHGGGRADAAKPATGTAAAFAQRILGSTARNSRSASRLIVRTIAPTVSTNPSVRV